MRGWSPRSWPQARSCWFIPAMYPLCRCSSVRPTTNPVFSLTYVYGSGLRGKVPPIVKMVTTPIEKMSMLVSYYDFSVFDSAGALASGGM